MLKLRLKNFRRFRESGEITFRPGLTIVSGQNGAGKSTLVESLGYALYGPKRGYAQDIRSDNAIEETCVECELMIDGQVVQVCRFNDRAEVSINGTLAVQGIPSSVSTANRQLGLLLGGLAREQFESTYVALQGDTAGLVADKPDQRRKIIESVLQLDVVKNAVRLQEVRRDGELEGVKTEGRRVADELQLDAQARELLRQFETARRPETRKQHTQRFMAAIEEKVERRRIEAGEVQRGVSTAKVEATKLEKECAEYQKTADGADEELKAHDNLYTRHHQYDVWIAEITGQAKQVKKDKTDLEARITLAAGCKTAAQDHERLKLKIAACGQRRTQLQTVKSRYNAMVQAQRVLANINRRLQALTQVEGELSLARTQELQAKQSYESLSTDPTTVGFQDWHASKASLDLEERQNKEALELLTYRPEEATCPTCGQKFTEHKPEQRIMHLKVWFDELLPKLRADLKEQKASLDNQRAEWNQQQEVTRETHQRAIRTTANAEAKVEQRDELLGQREEAGHHLQGVEEDWSELGEKGPYNPEEDKLTAVELGKLTEAATTLAQQAKEFAKLPQLQEQLNGKRSELEGINNRLSEQAQEQATVGYDVDAHKCAKDARAVAQGKLSETLKCLDAARKTVTDCLVVARQAQDAYEGAKRRHEQFQEAVHGFHREDRLHALLCEFQEYFFVANTARVAQRARQLLLHAVTDQSILGVEFDRDELFYLDASHSRRPVARLSGGEKALVGLCLRIALAEQAQSIATNGKVKLLILDEVLSSLDDERRDAVQRILEDVQQRGVFEQIILITHLDAVKQGWRAIGLEVRKTDSKASEVVSVSLDGTGIAVADEVGV